jgi:hypothetical protein
LLNSIMSRNFRNFVVPGPSSLISAIPFHRFPGILTPIHPSLFVHYEIEHRASMCFVLPLSGLVCGGCCGCPPRPPWKIRLVHVQGTKLFASTTSCAWVCPTYSASVELNVTAEQSGGIVGAQRARRSFRSIGRLRESTYAVQHHLVSSGFMMWSLVCVKGIPALFFCICQVGFSRAAHQRANCGLQYHLRFVSTLIQNLLQQCKK